MNEDRLAMMQMTTGYWVSKMIFCAAKLGVADRLAAGPVTTRELARQVGAHEESLHRLLRALASLGVFRETTPGTFGLTPRAELLRSDHPEGVRDFAIMANGELFEGWCELLHSVRTGEGAVQKRFGGDFFSVLAKDPSSAACFDRAMEQIHGPEVALMLDAFDWARFGHIVDVGGGSGQTLLAILDRHPRAKGTLLDLPDVVERARARSTGSPSAQRCTLRGGSFFDEVPAGDCLYLRHIIHDWSDQDSARILKACRRALGSSGTLVIVEKAIPAGNEPEFVKLLDINMLAIGGKERTLAQYEALLASAGLRLVKHHVTPGPIDLIEARV